MRYIFIITGLLLALTSFSQKKFLFDASKAETAGNADWIIDADKWNLDYTPYAHTGGEEANAQRYPTPAQSNVTSGTGEYYWRGALSAWGIELVKKGYYVETLPYNGKITYLDQGNPQDLSNYDVFVVCEPNIKFTSSEKSAILHFVKNGGGLFMIADHNNSDRNGDGDDSPYIWNDLMTNNQVQNNPFGIKFDYEFFNEKTNNIPTLSSDPLLNGPYGKVTRVEFYGGTSMTIYPLQNSTVKGVVFEEGSSVNGKKNVMCAYAEYGKGKVVALGDSSPADDGSGDYGDNLYDGWLEDANGNHRRLIMNGSVWLATSTTSVNQIVSDNYDIKVFGQGRSVVFSVSGLPAGNYTIRIYNSTGKEIYLLTTSNLNKNLKMNVPVSGLYVFAITQNGKLIRSGKVMIP